jgi:ABC-2 type transport system permease protein
MRTVSLLATKLRATTVFSGASVHQLRERDQLWVVPLAGVGILVALATMIFMLYQNYALMALLGLETGTPELPLVIATVLAWALAFVVGFPLALSILYFSRDGQLLASLPLRPGQIVAANTGLLYLYMLPVSVLVFVPALVAFFVAGGVSAWGVVAGALALVVMPLVPLGISILLVTGLVRIVNLSRFRTALEAMGMVLLVVMLIGVQLILSRSFAEGGDLVSLSAALADTLERVVSLIPPARWLARGVLPGGVGWLAVGAAFSAAVIALCAAVVRAGYLRRIATHEATRTRRGGAGRARLPQQRGVLHALVAREVRVLSSNSTFLFESVGEILVFPILLIVFRFAVPDVLVDQFLPFLQGTPYVLPALLALLVLLAGINSVSSSAISREGALFDLSLSLPVGGATQARGKLATYLLLFWPALAINAAIAVSILRLPWWNALVLCAAALPYLLLIGATTLYADVRRPLLAWSHPQQAVKQNVNVLIGMGLAVLCVAAVSLPAGLLATRGASSATVLVVAAGVAAAAAVLAERSVSRYADRRYAGAFTSGRRGRQSRGT